MKYFVYILFSEKLDQYYTGHSEDTATRIKQHNEGFFENAHTSLADDWKFVFQLECDSRTQAILIEKHIKKMKSKKYILNLIQYPEIGKKLKEKYDKGSQSR